MPSDSHPNTRRGVLRRVASALMLGALVAIPCVQAAELEPPAGRVLLEVRGAISKRNAGDAAAFDRAQLEALPQVTIRTTTPWTDGTTEFKGPLGRAVLSMVGASGTRLRARAANDYEVEIPVSDFDEIDVIIAMHRDGQAMSIRQKGPLWVIYPWSDRPELKNELYHSRAIWQLKELIVE